VNYLDLDDLLAAATAAEGEAFVLAIAAGRLDVPAIAKTLAAWAHQRTT